jgi:hypothetical protein
VLLILEYVFQPWLASDQFVMQWLESPDGTAAVGAHLSAVRALAVAKEVEELGAFVYYFTVRYLIFIYVECGSSESKTVSICYRSMTPQAKLGAAGGIFGCFSCT